MGIDSKAGFVGLVTAVGELGANQGALAIADNVTLRKEGALVCRPHYTTAALLRAYRAAYPYLGKLYYFAAANAIYSHTELPLLWEGGVPPAVRDDIQSAKDSRSNMYFASSEGIYKVCALTDTVLRMSGLDPPAITVLGLNTDPQFNNWLPPAHHVAYRAVARYTDANGLIVRSRPSGAFSWTNEGAVDCSVLVTVMYPTSTDVPDYRMQLEVYRSRTFPAAITIDDELQFVGEAISSGSGTATFWDFVEDIDRGVTLYTSPSRGGQENANDRAPGAACLERFRGSLFFGNTLGPQRVIFSYSPDTTNRGNVTGLANGIGYRIATGTTTSGSTAMTAVSPTTGVKVGQHVSYGPWSNTTGLGAYSGTVVSVAGTTVNVTPAATDTGSRQLLFQDAVSFGGGPAIPLGSPLSGAQGLLRTTSAAVIRADIGYSAYELTPPLPGETVTVVVERVKRGGPPFTVDSSVGYGEIIYLDGQGSKADVLPNGLAWAEPDEPEHVPPKNYARVGDTGKAILALVSTRDRLLIFKEDGLFQMTGQLASNFAIYPLDTTCLCILPGSTRRLQNTVYTLSNLGLVAVGEGGGVTIVSRPIQTEIARIVNLIRAAHKTSGLYLMPGLLGNTGAGDDAEGEYHLALGASGPTFFGGPPVGGHVLVYSVPRQGFTTFSFSTPPVALTTDGESIPHVLCAASILTPSTDLGPVSARICPRAFSDPALVGKLWTHLVAGFSDLTGTESISARFTSAESMLTTPIVTEQLEAPSAVGFVELPNGSLLRHPLPRAVTRAFLLFVELLIEVTDGSFTFELLGVESRQNVPNHKPTHGSGAG